MRRIDEMSRMPEPTKEDSSFKRKLSKREKKQLKKEEKRNKLKDKENADSAAGGGEDGGDRVGEKLYTGKNSIKKESSHLLLSIKVSQDFTDAKFLAFDHAFKALSVLVNSSKWPLICKR